MSMDISYIAFDPKEADVRWAEMLPRLVQNKERAPDEGASEEERRLHEVLNESDVGTRDWELRSLDARFGTVRDGYIEDGKSEYVLVEVLSLVLLGKLLHVATRELILKTSCLTEQQRTQALSDLQQEFHTDANGAKDFLDTYLENISKVVKTLEENPSFYFITEINGEISSADNETQAMLDRRLQALRQKCGL